MPPPLQDVDHIHIYVTDRTAAASWYEKVLGFTRVQEIPSWASSGGPIMLSSTCGNFKLAMFERPTENCRSTVAFAVTAIDFMAWQAHLAKILEAPPELEDHEVSWSIYFRDPDGNPYEITSYDYVELTHQLR